MNKFELVYVLSLIGTLCAVIFLFLNAKGLTNKANLPSDRQSKIKWLPLILVVFTLTTVLVLSAYYEKQLLKEQNLLLRLERKKFQLQLDSLTKMQKSSLIDSLSIYKDELADVLSRLERQKAVTGKGNKSISEARNVLSQTDRQIQLVQDYNEIIPIPDEKVDEYINSNTSAFEFECPPKSSNSYVDLSLNFQDKKLISKIDFIYLSIEEETDKPNHVNLILQQAYKPQNGFNKMRVKNYFYKPRIRVSIGYFLKADANMKTPTFYMVSCN